MVDVDDVSLDVPTLLTTVVTLPINVFKPPQLTVEWLELDKSAQFTLPVVI